MQKMNDNAKHHVVSVVLNRTANSTTLISMHSKGADEGTHRSSVSMAMTSSRLLNKR